MKKLRILHINAEHNWGGGEVQTLYLCQGLQAKGHTNIIVCPKGSALSKRAKDSKIKVINIPLKSIFDVFSIFKIRNLIIKNDIDIVHMHTWLAHHIGAIASRLSDTKAVVTRRMDFPVKDNLINRLFYDVLVDKVVAISDAVKKAILNSGISPYKVLVINSSLNLKKFNRSAVVSSKNDKIIIGTTSILSERKGLRYLIDAAPQVIQKHPTVRFHIVGDGPEKHRLISYVKENGLSNYFVFKGLRKDVSKSMMEFDLFVSTSLHEAFGVSIIESMACKIPIIATSVGGIPEIVKNNKTGILVPPKNSKALSKAILYLLKNPRIAKKMGKEGRKVVEEKFDAKIMVLRYQALYYKIINIR